MRGRRKRSREEKTLFMKTLYGLTPEEIGDIVVASGLPKYRAAQLADWIYKKNVLSWDEIRNVPKDALQKISEKIPLTSLEPVEEKKAATGGSIKFLFKTLDGHLLESVLIQKKEEDAETGGRQTVCVSTQLGCKVQCVFCASGQGEIYPQPYGRRNRRTGREDRPDDGEKDHKCGVHGHGRAAG